MHYLSQAQTGDYLFIDHGTQCVIFVHARERQGADDREDGDGFAQLDFCDDDVLLESEYW